MMCPHHSFFLSFSLSHFIQLLKDRSASYASAGSGILSDDGSLLSSLAGGVSEETGGSSSWRTRNETRILTMQLPSSSSARTRRHQQQPQQQVRRPAEQSGEKRPDLAFDPSLEEYMSCGPRICTKIYCSIANLAKGESVLVSVRSRIWRETAAEIAQPAFDVSSKIVAVVTQLPYDVDPGYLGPQVTLVTTHVHVTGLEKPRPIPLLVYLLAVIGGLLLLALLVLLFYRCGFFKRKRPPLLETDSEPLHSSVRNGGYHYRRGDTSL